ncbi:hypothetical protein GA0115240_16707 [Streptomyces sp. DvalAA-14]|uniref:helix-turn-helix domain-containing protein n=1 Tax=unclassified Streptomyces TaxID=2593676 RepID=UPI00081B00DE|nr:MULTISPECIES: helix-turn-helix transcriptional regulator [unclassified Streptomyces]MYS24666.1 hypothetical protein [Streptomyces sp. SID4948]SCE48239.1 hypothetical protein GA0115240_16707 [Streptomyces sp. DvalAA-14]
MSLAGVLASGLTVADLAEQSHNSKSKISVLLRGEDLYPRWEIIHSVLRVLEIPAWPVCRLWVAAAFEANKKQEWIDGCISTAVLTIAPQRPPLDHRAFALSNTGAYSSYGEVFLRDRAQVRSAVSNALDILWLRWDEALRSPQVQRFAWRIFRRIVGRWRAARGAGPVEDAQPLSLRPTGSTRQHKSPLTSGDIPPTWSPKPTTSKRSPTQAFCGGPRSH